MSDSELLADEPLLAAAVELLGRTGAQSFQLRYSDDETPVVWIAVVAHRVDRRGVPIPRGGKERYEVASALSPALAALRLCELLVDGGICRHCGKPSAVTEDFAVTPPVDTTLCWYQFDPELATFRRSCEGS